MLHSFLVTSDTSLSTSIAQFLIPLPWHARQQHLQFAAANDFGLEILAFCSGPALNNEQVRRERSQELQKQLQDFTGPLAFHGAFIDIALHSIDDSIAAASKARIERDLATACELGCGKAVFHTGFNPNVSVPRYAEEVVEGQSAFWADAITCLLYTSPSPRDRTRSRMPSSA